MTRQNISTGSAPNDGAGDTLPNGAIKTNTNFVELFQYLGGDSDFLPDRLVHPRFTTISVNGTLATNFDYYILNKGTALAITLPAGAYVGEHKFFSNRGAGVATITTNLAGAFVSFALAQNEAAQIIWDGTEWFIVGNQSVVTLA
jgi:hypothetical protein